MKLVVQEWEESERGWGVRPDGYSFHLSEKDLSEYIERYWARMPKEIPDEYSRPSGSPFTINIEVCNRTLRLLGLNKGVRLFERSIPNKI